MSKILTDNNLIEKFLTRGVENSYPNKKFIEDRLKEGKKLKQRRKKELFLLQEN